MVLMLSGRTGSQEFAPLTDRKLLDKAWADGTAASLAGKPATVEAAATDDKKTAAPLPFNWYDSSNT